MDTKTIKFIKAMKSEMPKSAIDFSSSQRRKLEVGLMSENGTITTPSDNGFSRMKDSR